MSNPPCELWWVPEAVAGLMHANGVRDRAELAKLKIGVGQTTIYRSFDENWAGKVQVRLLAALARWTKIPVADLVACAVTETAPVETVSEASSGGTA